MHIRDLNPEGWIMTFPQQWQYMNLTRNSFHILFLAKDIIEL